MATSKSKATALRVSVVEDHAMFRQAVVHYLEKILGHQVVSISENGRQAIENISACRPELVVLDLMLPDCDGFEVAEKISSKLPYVKILVLTSHCADDTLLRIEKSRVNGLLDKNSQSLDDLGQAIEAISAGIIYYSPAFQEARNARTTDPLSYSKTLSEWERTILKLIGQSLTDDEIGTQLNISPKTVATHRGKIMRKLGIPSTPKLINFAISHGISQIPLRRGDSQVYT
jgi:DNA-binding NarL/FixJ family response regulator